MLSSVLLVSASPFALLNFASCRDMHELALVHLHIPMASGSWLRDWRRGELPPVGGTRWRHPFRLVSVICLMWMFNVCVYSFMLMLMFAFLLLGPTGTMGSNAGLLFSEPGFLDFQILRLSIIEISYFWKIFSENILVRYRGINNKGVLERSWTKCKVLEATSTTLKCQFAGKCRKVDFSMSCTTKSAENLHVAPYGRCGLPGNP